MSDIWGRPPRAHAQSTLGPLSTGGHKRSSRNSRTDTLESCPDRISSGVSFPHRPDTRIRASTRDTLVEWGHAPCQRYARLNTPTLPNERFHFGSDLTITGITSRGTSTRGHQSISPARRRSQGLYGESRGHPSQESLASGSVRCETASREFPDRSPTWNLIS